MPALSHHLRFRAFGVTGEVVSDDSELLQRAAGILPPGWQPTSARATARFTVRRADPPESLLALEAAIRHHVAQHAVEDLFIHAGVVAVGGAGILIPGLTHAGKTTLVAALLEAGATYYSDEYAVVDRRGAVRPYPRPLSVRDDEGRTELVTVPAGRTARSAIRPALIVVTAYRHGARWRARPLTRAEGAMALLQHTIAARSRPGDAFRAVRQLTERAVAVEGERGEARGAAAEVLALAHVRRAPPAGRVAR